MIDPKRKSGNPVLVLTIYFTSCLKFEKGLSKTIFETLNGYILAYMRAVTAPIDLPHNVNCEMLYFSLRKETTFLRS